MSVVIMPPMAEKRVYNRIVVKLGTNLLTAGTGKLNADIMQTLTSQVATLVNQGAEIVIVSSGAIAAGKEILSVSKNRDIPYRQMMAAVGQSRLMNAYDTLFSRHG